MNVLTDDAVRFFRSEGDIARDLRVMMGDLLGAKAEGRGFGVAGLRLEARPVDRAAIEAWWCSSLETAAAQAEILERFP
jgi:alkanesulfonate monooxygenase SsuD/methylene tetrahydromethanopterin reductase-like flavin-dependent oxidoreductase (luciferase family)